MTMTVHTEWTDNIAAGYLPMLINNLDARSASKQLEAKYVGGWSPFPGFTLRNWEEEGKATLKYPEDPPMREISRSKLRDETLILFQGAWLAIVQPDGSHEIARVD